MPKRVKRFTTSRYSFSKEELLEIKEALSQLTNDFDDVEKKCEIQLSQKVRDGIARLTYVCVAQWAAEKFSVEVKALNPRILRLRRDAMKLLELLEGGPIDPKAFNPTNKRWKRIRKTLPIKRPRAVDTANFLYNFLIFNIMGTQAVLANLERPTLHSVALGKAWEQWIYLLKLLMIENHLPHRARKDVDKTTPDQISQFVIMVDELQRRLPHKMQRRVANRTSLSQAMSRAWKGRDLKLSVAEAIRLSKRSWVPFLWRASLKSAVGAR